MAVDMERLVVSLTAEIKGYERQLAKARAVTDRSAKAIESRFAKANAVLATFGKGLLAGVAAGGVAGIVGKIGQVAKSVAQIGQEAQRAGVSAQALQEIGYVAKQSGVGVDALVDGLKELNLRADEWIVTGRGPAAEAFARLGYTAEELKTKLQDPSALFTEIIGKLGQLETAAQIRIADEVFGGSAGEQFVRFISQGEQGIRNMIDEAHRLGLVMSNDVIESAAELDRQFNKVAETVGSALKQAIVSASAALVRFIDEFNAFEDRATGSLKTRFSELQTRRAQLTFGPEGEPGLVQSALGLIGKDAASELAAIDEEMARIAEELKQRALPRLRQELLGQAGASPYVPPTTGSTSKAKKDPFDPDPQAFRNMLGYTESYVEAQELANQKLEAFGDIAMDAANSLATAFADGKLEAGEILSIVGQIAQQLLRMPGGLSGVLGLLGGGGGFNPTTGGFASMLGIPGYAKGTNNHPGGLAIVGERGPELVNLPRGAQVIPDFRLPAMAQGGGTSVNAPVVVNIDAKGADREGLARVEAQVAKLKAELPMRIVTGVREANKRNVKFS